MSKVQASRRKGNRYHLPKFTICHKTGKHGYDPIGAALMLEHVQLRARRPMGEESRFYTCEFCGQQHLTSQDRRLGSRIAHSA
jgi:hypothetical protein